MIKMMLHGSDIDGLFAAKLYRVVVRFMRRVIERSIKINCSSFSCFLRKPYKYLRYFLWLAHVCGMRCINPLVFRALPDRLLSLRGHGVVLLAEERCYWCFAPVFGA